MTVRFKKMVFTTNFTIYFRAIHNDTYYVLKLSDGFLTRNYFLITSYDVRMPVLEAFLYKVSEISYYSINSVHIQISFFTL